MHADQVPPAPLVGFSTTILPKYIKPGMLSVKDANTLVLQLIIFMTDTVDADFLKYASRFLTPSYYDDIVAERNVLHICGYPLCSASPTRKILGKDVPQIYFDANASKLPGSTSWRNEYCGKRHFQCSTLYRAQLSDEAIWARPDIAYLPNGTAEWENSMKLLEEIVTDFEKSNSLQLNSGEGTGDMKDVLSSLSKLKLLPKDQDIQIENKTNGEEKSQMDTIRERIDNAKKEKFEESVLNLRISERSFENPQRAAVKVDMPSSDTSMTVEGYVLGTAAQNKPPQSYLDWLEKKQEEKKAFIVDGELG